MSYRLELLPWCLVKKSTPSLRPFVYQLETQAAEYESTSADKIFDILSLGILFVQSLSDRPLCQVRITCSLCIQELPS